MDKRIWIGIIAIILLLLMLLWYFDPITITEPEWEQIGNPSETNQKLHEEQVRTSAVLWDDCCEGEIRVDFNYSWVFYDDDWTPADLRCNEPVQWTIRDSIGKEVFNSESRTPVDSSYTILDGTWDCVRPWMVTVINGCLYPITYSWDLTMWCK